MATAAIVVGALLGASGVAHAACVEQGPDNDCDGVDDDCNGLTDDGFKQIKVTCGEGFCFNNGKIKCIDGAQVNTCEPKPPEDDSQCDGLDNDCDGDTDEHYVPEVISCGQGVCVNTGTRQCINGLIKATCIPLPEQGDDDDCDGIDQNCNGVDDDNFKEPVTTCGSGECAQSGKLWCVDALLVDSCDPTIPDVVENLCDGIDDDCDGLTDEDYVPVPSSCGQGLCANGSMTSCEGGVTLKNCTPLPPAGTDADCDGIDQDCDGFTDDGWVPTTTSCGTGACSDAGQMVCSAGSVIDTCSPADPAADDSTCDGVDDDCDGLTDEDYAPEAASCGAGACFNSNGATYCEGGVVKSSCVPGPTTGADDDCDGVDDDCDGAVDEHWVAVATTCGQGGCASEGQLVCKAGATEDTCNPGSPSLWDNTCDGIDDDCDGVADEDVAAKPTSCGKGVCSNTGESVCLNGTMTDLCEPLPTTGADDDCDLIDDDCNGVADDNWPEPATLCGADHCSAIGKLKCVAGATIDTCEPSGFALDDASCDGIDDDCDGLTDEDWAPEEVSCGVGACAATGVTACASGVLFDICDPSSPLGTSDASCDGIDDDCDGTADEDYPVAPTSCGLGKCAADGELVCEGGLEVDTCNEGSPSPVDPCDGIDNDCDGEVDNGFEPKAISCGVGSCTREGVTACDAGAIVDLCEPGAPLASDDASCDGIDDDCDGFPDEDWPATVTECGTGGCHSFGKIQCLSGVPTDTCEPDPAAADDANCDGVDDDCDGVADEDYAPETVTCGKGACSAEGTTVCQAAIIYDVCEPVAPAGADDATCDGVDDDCDGHIDEDHHAITITCGVGACVANGDAYCVDGALLEECTPLPAGASDSDCDGIDDDCDGAVDEDYVGVDTACGIGACASIGQTACEGGKVVDLCEPPAPAADDATCDGVDDDCDGQADEDVVPEAITCGIGACAAPGQVLCIDGAEYDNCTPYGPLAPTDVTCNQIDDDCDGEVDEEFPVSPTTCGVGACAADGEWECVAGDVVDSCAPGSPADSDATCDGIDDDCDGIADENHQPEPMTCGVGECVAQGVKKCEAGGLVDYCTPNAGADGDATCDGHDDDCDGSIDEDYDAPPTACGVGACASEGEIACQSGALVDTCLAGAPGGGDATCDGVDDDCDSHTDEDFGQPAIECGVGACASSGVTICEDGVAVDHCEPGAAAAGDASCDGIDDDCDGAVDEDFSAEPTLCGIGACSAEGALSCTEGAVVDSCTEGTPAAADDSCDAIDSDCDGETDEEYAGAKTNCGVGACSRVGAVACFDGEEIDACLPGEPAAFDDTCDGIDDDCDGSVDEDCAGASCGSGNAWTVAQGGVVHQVSSILGDEDVQSFYGYGTKVPWSSATGHESTDRSTVMMYRDSDGVLSFVMVHDAPLSDAGGIVQLSFEGLGDDVTIGVTDDGIGTQDVFDLAAGEFAWQWGSSTTDGMALSGLSDSACFTFAASTLQGIDGFDVVDGETGESLALSDDPLAGPVTVCALGCCVPTSDVDDTCNGLDDDCDGEVDEDYLPESSTCGVGPCANTGTTLCVGGQVEPLCIPLAGEAFDWDCDDIDDDCDGEVDEDHGAEPTSCGIGTCGAVGEMRCEGGEIVDTCEPAAGAADDSACNGLDDDCDGEVDEEFAPATTDCGQGVCAAHGVSSCVDGVELDSCEAGEPQGADDDCDLVDEDCDGSADEDYFGGDTTCGVGGCAATGAILCIDGQVTDTCAATEPGDVDSCNGKDDDCDGLVDEDFGAEATSCGIGACVSQGVTSCVEGKLLDSCVAGEPADGDATCDSVDDDCDGELDEDWNDGPTTCGVGACAATGWVSCVDHQAFDTCVEGTPAADDSKCDGKDNDCDGAVDEDYTPEETTCGLGVCVSAGVSSCVEGVELDSCLVGAADATTDDTCDGVDQDCDGTADEDVPAEPTSCGIGACAAEGVYGCFDGAMTDTCIEGTPAEDDSKCDGKDNDCDGQVDEEFTAEATTCGKGVCVAEGVSSCVEGELLDSCVEGDPTGADDDCDGVDQDCTGAADDNFPVESTFCGTGICAGKGKLTCAGGEITDSCVESAPAADDATCDGFDDDCDGDIDEDCPWISCGANRAYKVTQGDTSFDIRPVASGTDVETFYGYGHGDAYSANTGFEAADRSTVILHGDPSGQLGFVLVHDAAGSGSGGHLELSIDGLAEAELVVEDDASGGQDSYDLETGEFVWEWAACCTDGIAFASVPHKGCITITPGVVEGLGGFDLIDGATGERIALGSTTEPITICSAPCCVPDGDYDSCDSKDNDCDGLTDEDFVPTLTSCGTGGCAAEGENVCVDGDELNTCVASEPADEEDASCDGIDEDCDGETDEEGVAFVSMLYQADIARPVAPIMGTESVEDFYGWAEGAPSSPSTGLERDDTTVVFMYRAPDGTNSLVVLHDAPGSKSAGAATLTIEGLEDATMPVSDDPGDPKDLANGIFHWHWWGCCSDGLVLSDIPDDACFTITPRRLEGIRKMVLLTPGPNGDLERVPLKMDEPFSLCASACCAAEPTEAAEEAWTVSVAGSDDEGVVSPVVSDMTHSEMYSYGKPIGSSSNAGYEADNRMTVLLHRDEAGDLGLMVFADQAKSGTGGKASLTIKGLEGTAVKMDVFDDAAHRKDGYDLAAGEFHWVWYGCCNDGMALSRVPDDRCLTFALDGVAGLTGVDIVDADGSRYAIDDVNAPFTLCPKPWESPTGLGSCGGLSEAGDALNSTLQ